MLIGIKVRTREELNKLNKQTGAALKNYPAIYTEIHGELRENPIKRENFLKDIGYLLVSVN